MKIKANKIIAIFLLLIFSVQNYEAFALGSQEKNIEDMLPPLNKVDEPAPPKQQPEDTIELNIPIKPIEKPKTIEQTYNNQNTPTKNIISNERPAKLERIIPQGAALQVQVNNIIDSQTCEAGQNIETTLVKPIEANGATIVPQNSTVIGQVTKLSKAGSGDKSAVLEITFTNIRTPRGQLIPINAKIKTIDESGVLRGGEIDKQLSKSAGIVAVSSLSGTLTGAGLAALCGAAAVGSVIGLTIGAAMGINWIKNQKGNDIIIPAGTNLLLELTQTATLAGE